MTIGQKLLKTLPKVINKQDMDYSLSMDSGPDYIRYSKSKKRFTIDIDHDESLIGTKTQAWLNFNAESNSYAGSYMGALFDTISIESFNQGYALDVYIVDMDPYIGLEVDDFSKSTLIIDLVWNETCTLYTGDTHKSFYTEFSFEILNEDYTPNDVVFDMDLIMFTAQGIKM